MLEGMRTGRWRLLIGLRHQDDGPWIGKGEGNGNEITKGARLPIPAIEIAKKSCTFLRGPNPDSQNP